MSEERYQRTVGFVQFIRVIRVQLLFRSDAIEASTPRKSRSLVATLLGMTLIAFGANGRAPVAGGMQVDRERLDAPAVHFAHREHGVPRGHTIPDDG